MSFAPGSNRVGFMVDGTIQDETDVYDNFTFARSRSARYSIQLCPPGEMICSPGVPIDSGTTYFEVVDQNGNVVLSSAEGDNVERMYIEAGVPYYIRVVAKDTMGTAVGYTLTAYETN